MEREERQKRVKSIEGTIEDLRKNQKLIMGCLMSYLDNGLQERDLKIVKWAYSQRFKMLQKEKEILKTNN